MPEEFIPDQGPQRPETTHSHRRRRRKRRTIAEAHARDRRIKNRGGGPSKLWWFVPVIIGAIGAYVFYVTGFFGTRNDSMAGKGPEEIAQRMEAQEKLSKAEEFRNADLPQKALPILDQLLEEDPDLPRLAFELAHVHYELGDLEESRKYAQLALTRGENLAVSNYLIGVTYCLNSQFRDALPYFEAAYKNYDQSAPLLQNWADALRAVGKPTLALEKLERALGQRPNSKILQMKIALTRIDTGEAPIVRKEAERDLRWTPDYVPALLVLAALEFKEKDISGGKVYLDKIRESAGSELLKNYLQDVYFLRYQNEPTLQEYFPNQEERLKLAEQSQRDMAKEPPAPATNGQPDADGQPTPSPGFQKKPSSGTEFKTAPVIIETE